ncbi:Protein of unknown function [Gryllus bimaculatus]|nr:Protein of unknown function [Gryllus bimaculatus]
MENAARPQRTRAGTFPRGKTKRWREPAGPFRVARAALPAAPRRPPLPSPARRACSAVPLVAAHAAAASRRQVQHSCLAPPITVSPRRPPADTSAPFPYFHPSAPRLAPWGPVARAVTVRTKRLSAAEKFNATDAPFFTARAPVTSGAAAAVGVAVQFFFASAFPPPSPPRLPPLIPFDDVPMRSAPRPANASGVSSTVRRPGGGGGERSSCPSDRGPVARKMKKNGNAAAAAADTRGHIPRGKTKRWRRPAPFRVARAASRGPAPAAAAVPSTASVLCGPPGRRPCRRRFETPEKEFVNMIQLWFSDISFSISFRKST